MLLSLLILFLLPILITSIVPRLYLGLYLWCFIVLCSIYSFPGSQPYRDKSGADAYGEATLYLISYILIFSIIIRLAIALFAKFFNQKNETNKRETRESKLINKITFIAYGILSGYYIFLFFSNLLENYKPAWEAYSIFIATTILFLVLSQLVQKYSRATRYSWLKSLYLFFHSVCITMIAISIISFNFSLLAIRETNKIIGKYTNRKVEYCIQPKIDTWLDLTPLTTWNKKSRDWGATSSHAVLVIKNDKTTELYNWSYKSRKWDYLATGFLSASFNSPSFLKCNLSHVYLKSLPLLFPKPTRANIGNKRLNIPSKYFAVKKENTLFSYLFEEKLKRKNIQFVAKPPYFSNVRYIFTKLPKNYSFHTNILVFSVESDRNLSKRAFFILLLELFPNNSF